MSLSLNYAFFFTRIFVSTNLALTMESVFCDIRTRSSFANASQVTRENAVKQVITRPANADIFSPVFVCLRHKEYVTFRAQTNWRGLPFERGGDARQKF